MSYSEKVSALEISPLENSNEIDVLEKTSKMDMNRFATRKTVATGLLDVAILTANASQLKFVIQLGKEKHQFYTLMVILIVASMVLQVSVGICFLYIGSLNINHAKSHNRAEWLNNCITAQVLIITVLNIIISSFGFDELGTTS